MRQKDWIAVSLAAVLLTAAAAGGYYYVTPEQTFQRRCVASLKDQMRAPSTFAVIDQSFYAEPVQIDEAAVAARIVEVEAELEELNAANYDISFRADDLTRELRDLTERTLAARRVRDGGHQPRSFTSYVEYEAANSFGVPLRDTAVCEHNSWDNRFGGETAFTSRVRSARLTCYSGHECYPER